MALQFEEGKLDFKSNILTQLGPKWQKLSQRFPGIELRQLLRSNDLEIIANLVKRAMDHYEKQGKSYTRPDFEVEYVLDCPPGVPLGAILSEVHAWNLIKVAARPTTAIDPSGPSGNNAKEQFQWYLNPAPIGIDARFAWTVPGGDGAGQQFIDLEGGWELEHDEFSNRNISQIDGTIIDSSRSHGTSVLGVVCAEGNSGGIVGIVHAIQRVQVISHSADPTTIARMITAAANALPIGGVLLLEVSLRKSGSGPMLPAELDPAVFKAIRLAVDSGVVVVEAAGNSHQDLDAYTDPDQGNARIFDASVRDSGAIIVGGGSIDFSSGNTEWNRWFDSNYGTRVDCFGWADSVQTAASTTRNPTDGYTSDFTGTSSAAAIIAGAAIAVQGMAQAHPSIAARFDPLELRDILRDPTGNHTATAKPAQDRIGVMPNLSAIFARM